MYLLYVGLEASSGFSQQSRVISLGDGEGLAESFHPKNLLPISAYENYPGLRR